MAINTLLLKFVKFQNAYCTKKSSIGIILTLVKQTALIKEVSYKGWLAKATKGNETRCISFKPMFFHNLA